MSWPELLYPTLTRRAMPETVARIITDDVGSAWARDWKRTDFELLTRAAATYPLWRVSSMPEDFEAVPGAAAQIGAVLAVFGVAVPAVAEMAEDRDAIAQLIDELGAPLGWSHGMDWKADRLTAAERRGVPSAGVSLVRARSAGFPLALAGGRTYNKHIRVLRNLEDKRRRMAGRQDFRRLVLIGRSGFACDIDRGRFCADPNAAALIAWLTAVKNRRRQFTLSGRGNPVDHVGNMLLGRCERAAGTDWEMIAEVWPRPQILARLDGEQVGRLLGRWWTVMRDSSVLLAAEWAKFGEGTDRMQMTVRRGIDSSAWNTQAQAFNAARAAWLNCTTAGGAGALTGPFCPGKVMRVMAADLAAWHTYSGGGVHPDTRVWALLPYPWDVIAGLADCPAELVAATCSRAGVDPVAGGWTAPLAPGAIAAFTATPELVHGVSVASPEWAGLLRRAGVFSGKRVTADAAGLRGQAQAEGQIISALPAYDEAGHYAGIARPDGTIDLADN